MNAGPTYPIRTLATLTLLPEDAPGSQASTQPAAVVLRLRGHLRTNLTFAKALQAYAEGVAQSRGRLIVCGLHPATITQLRSAGLPDSVTLLAQGDQLDGSLAQAHDLATAWLATSAPPPVTDPQP